MTYYENTTGQLISTCDGFSLFYQKWIPPETITQVIVFQHGLGEHSGRYQNLIEAFVDTGTAFYALDARGHGRSSGKRGHITKFRCFVDDLHDLIYLARQAHENQKVFLLGHSMGGALVLKYALTENYQQELRGLIASSPAIEPVMDTVKQIQKKIAAVLSQIIPSLTTASQLNVQNLSHNPNVIRAYQADPLVHDQASARVGHGLFIIHEEIYEKAASLTIPVYLLHGTADQITSAPSTEKFYHLLTTRDKTLKLYEGLYHETMNEPEEDRQRVLDDLKTWVLAH